jgi:hypothetical protein
MLRIFCTMFSFVLGEILASQAVSVMITESETTEHQLNAIEY